jgi:hypothetical protein
MEKKENSVISTDEKGKFKHAKDKKEFYNYVRIAYNKILNCQNECELESFAKRFTNWVNGNNTLLTDYELKEVAVKYSKIVKCNRIKTGFRVVPSFPNRFNLSMRIGDLYDIPRLSSDITSLNKSLNGFLFNCIRMKDQNRISFDDLKELYYNYSKLALNPLDLTLASQKIYSYNQK